MIPFLRASASGMLAQQATLDVIANNLSNLNTAGFKGSRVDFEDLVYRQLSLTGEFGPVTEDAPRSVTLGAGVRTTHIERILDQGDLQGSDDPLHLAIDGEGLFIVQLADGTAAYTRNGTFRLDAQRRLVTASGAYVQPDVVVPPDASDFWVTPDGIVNARVGDEGRVVQVGEVQLARFANPSGLLSSGQNLHLATAASGDPEVGHPGDPGFGRVLGGMLERSNVNVAVEMTNLLMAQRAYQLNARTLQTIDEMLGMANNLRR